MRERLIELLKQKACPYVVCDRECGECRNVEMYEDNIENIADHLLANGVIVPPCKIGDEVFFVLIYEDDPMEEWCVENETVTEVGESGIWSSGSIPPKDDFSLHREWEELGSNWFLTLEEAEKELERRKIAKREKQ